MKKLIFIGILIIFVAFLWNCSTNTFYEELVTLENAQWDRNRVLSFNVIIDDTLSAYNVFIVIRNNGNYSRRNLYLFTTIVNPKGEKLRDTVNCILADEKGRWYGKSNLGDLYYNCFMYKNRVTFPTKGNYKILIEQAMRSPIIENIEDVGIKIERIPRHE